MKRSFKIALTIILVLAVCVGAVAYGALTAPKPTVTKPVTMKLPTKTELVNKLKTEQATITSVLLASYPKIATDYIVNQGQLYDQGEWYGTTLTYKGTDTMNRDTLRVLMQKKQGLWIVRTTPPEPLLSAKKYADVPRSVLQSINKAVSLPGTDTSPSVNATE